MHHGQRRQGKEISRSAVADLRHRAEYTCAPVPAHECDDAKARKEREASEDHGKDVGGEAAPVGQRTSGSVHGGNGGVGDSTAAAGGAGSWKIAVPLDFARTERAETRVSGYMLGVAIRACLIKM